MANLTGIAGFVQLRAVVLAAAMASIDMTGSAGSHTAVAADVIAEAHFAGAAGRGTFKWLVRSLKWLSSRWPRLDPLTDAIENLLRRLGEMTREGEPRSGEVRRELEALMAKVAELEERLAAQSEDKAEIARMRFLLQRLRAELKGGDPYKVCCEEQPPRLGRPQR